MSVLVIFLLGEHIAVDCYQCEEACKKRLLIGKKIQLKLKSYNWTLKEINCTTMVGRN